MLKIWDSLIKCMEWVAMICLIGLVAVVDVQIVLRYVFAKPFDWGEEAGRFLFIWVVFLGSIVLVRYGRHITVAALARGLGVRLNKVRELAYDTIILAFLIVLFYESTLLLQMFGSNLSPMMGIPLYSLFTPVWLFAGISMIDYVRKMISSGRELITGS